MGRCLNCNWTSCLCPSIIYASIHTILHLSYIVYARIPTIKFILELCMLKSFLSCFEIFTNRCREIRKYIEDARHGSLDGIPHQDSTLPLQYIYCYSELQVIVYIRLQSQYSQHLYTVYMGVLNNEFQLWDSNPNTRTMFHT